MRLTGCELNGRRERKREGGRGGGGAWAEQKREEKKRKELCEMIESSDNHLYQLLDFNELARRMLQPHSARRAGVSSGEYEHLARTYHQWVCGVVAWRARILTWQPFSVIVIMIFIVFDYAICIKLTCITWNLRICDFRAHTASGSSARNLNGTSAHTLVGCAVRTVEWGCRRWNWIYFVGICLHSLNVCNMGCRAFDEIVYEF